MTDSDDIIDARLASMGQPSAAEIRALWARSVQIGDIIRAAGHDSHDPHTQMPKLSELAQQMIDMPKWDFTTGAPQKGIK